MAWLPLMVYRTGRDGRRNVATDHPLYRVLHDSPNADQTAVDFWEFICACLEMHGNAYCETERAIDGRIIALSPPIIPELMSVRRLDNGELEYRWVENGKQRVETQGRIVHIRGFGGSPLGGLSTLSFGRQAFRSEEHTSELQSLMRISYAVFCLKKKKKEIYIEIVQNVKILNSIT